MGTSWSASAQDITCSPSGEEGLHTCKTFAPKYRMLLEDQIACRWKDLPPAEWHAHTNVSASKLGGAPRVKLSLRFMTNEPAGKRIQLLRLCLRLDHIKVLKSATPLQLHRTAASHRGMFLGMQTCERRRRRRNCD